MPCFKSDVGKALFMKLFRDVLAFYTIAEVGIKINDSFFYQLAGLGKKILRVTVNFQAAGLIRSLFLSAVSTRSIAERAASG